MVTKPTKPKAAPVAPAVAISPTTAAIPALPASATPVTTPTTPVVANTGDPSLATGANYQSACDNLVEMGFQLDQVKAAMRGIFYSIYIL
jgi:hypothetical protein